MSLVEQAQQFIATSSGPPTDLLQACLDDGGLDGLHATQLLFEDMYGGITFNFELKAPAGYCLIRWGIPGLHALVEAGMRSPRSKNVSIVLETLSTLASGRRRTFSSGFAAPALVETVERLCPDWAAIPQEARALLTRFLLHFPSDDDAIFAIGHQFTMSAISQNLAGAREVFEASAARFLAVSDAVLVNFQSMIETQGSDEPAFQRFLSEHPQLIDPMTVEVWPQPSLWGAKEPDFVLRRADDTYLIVEIECPAKLLLTGTGQLSAETSHAVHQVIDYADKLVQRQEIIAATFPRFRAPDCLVINGLESPLSPEQKRMLVLENGHRRGVRIAGFDWLASRARAIAANFVGHRVRISEARLT